MRPLFIVVCKVIGLMQIYTGLTYIFGILPLLRMLTTQAESPDAETAMSTVFYGEQITLSAISLGAMAMLTFGMAWLLLVKSDWFADNLKISTTDAVPLLQVETLLYAGTKLIGLYIIVQGIPSFMVVLYQLRHLTPFSGYMWMMVAEPVVRMAIGLFLMTKTTVLSNFMMGMHGQRNTSVGIGR